MAQKKAKKGKQTSPKCSVPTFAVMRKLVRQYESEKYGDKATWLRLRGITYDTIHDYKRKLRSREALPKKARPNMQQRRLLPGGRKAKLPKEVEDRIYDWVKQRRGGNEEHFNHVVTVSQLLFYACVVSKQSLLEGWLWGFMRRYKLSLRCVTTNKQIDTPVTKAVLEEFRYQNHALLTDVKKHPHTYNMDETCIYYDMSHKRTVAVRGSKTVAAYHTKGDSHRVTVVACVSAAGGNMPPLIVYVDPPLTPFHKLKTEAGRRDREKAISAQSTIEKVELDIPMCNEADEDEVVFEEDGMERKQVEAGVREEDIENMTEEQRTAAAKRL